MKERYKVLGAMTSLGEFTVEDVANKTGVKKNTVNTVLGRDKALLEEVPSEATGRRGGQPKRYRIKPESAHLVHSELEDLYKSLPKSSSFTASNLASPEPRRVKVPLGLLTAEDTLLQRYPKSVDLNEKQQLFELAELDYQKGLFDSERILAEAREPGVHRTIKGSVDRINALQKVFEVELFACSLNAGRLDEATEPATVKSWISRLTEQVSEAIGSLIPVFNTARESFTAEPSEVSLRPQSQNYISAKSLLDRASLERQSQQRSCLLDEARESLDRLQAENPDGEFRDVTNAFVDYERGRLAFLKNENEAAREFFERARSVFSFSDKYTDEVTKIDHHLAIIFVEENSFSPGVLSSRMEVPATLAALNRIDDKAHVNYPLVGFLKSLLLKTVSHFTQTERELRQTLEATQNRVRALERALAAPPSRVSSMEFPQESRVYDMPRLGVAHAANFGTVIPRLLEPRVMTGPHPQVVVRRHQCYEPGSMESGAMEMSQAIALGSENTLQCSLPEPRGRLRTSTESLLTKISQP